MGISVEDKNPLRWPDGWDRTRIQDREGRGGWKKTFKQYRDSLAKEMARMGVTEMLVTFNASGMDRMDCGVAVYFSKGHEQSFEWQDGLGLQTPAPTLEEIDAAYRKKAMQHHPDRGGDIEIFKAMTKHRDAARAWVLGTERQEHEYVIACDKFSETRLNLAAIRLGIAALRTLERVGVSSILERSMLGFKTALPAYAGKEAGSGSTPA
jgi:hypothetical protein